MQSETTPLIIGILVFISSLVSLRVGISVAIIEIIFGAIVGNFGLQPENWMLYLANFGGIVLTFLAGTEIDTGLLKSKFKESFLIGIFSFLLPFVGAFLCAQIIGWNFKASLIAGTALSTTSLAVVYSVLVEMGLSKTTLGKLLMASSLFFYINQK
ncbi:cation:proton antiporter [Candidatus Nomurabacteria bacterium]|nr:cation:proton antiporter [Candidatus Nomurabacteria bacterium]